MERDHEARYCQMTITDKCGHELDSHEYNNLYVMTVKSTDDGIKTRKHPIPVRF